MLLRYISIILIYNGENLKKKIEFDTKDQISSATNHYEHHAAIKNNHMLPFHYKKSVNCKSSVCNWHENIEILLIEHGNGILRYGAETIPLSEEMIIIINSQTIHTITSNSGISFYMFIIDNSFFEDNGIDITKFQFQRVLKDFETAKICRDTYDLCQNIEKSKDFLSFARLRHMVLSLVINICEKHICVAPVEETKSDSTEKYVKKLWYINDNYKEKITLDTISRVIGINKSYFAREFKKYAGQTVHTYINYIRCQNADLCLSSGMSVTDAAMSSGFETLSYFSRTYRKTRGYSPKSGKNKNNIK